MLDQIHLKNIECYCKLGVYDEERERGQCVHIDLELDLDLSAAGTSDKVSDTINYVDISHAVQEVTMVKPFHLIEHLCTEVCNELFKRFTKVQAVTIQIHKPVINAKWFVGEASVKICRHRIPSSRGA